MNWKPIKSAPIGPLVLLANEETGDVVPGYGEWGKAPIPYWIALDPTGIGRWKATHWTEMPAFSEARVLEAAE